MEILLNVFESELVVKTLSKFLTRVAEVFPFFFEETGVYGISVLL